MSSHALGTSSSRFRGRRLRFFLIGFAILMVGWGCWHLSLSYRIEAHFKKIHEQGYPVTLKELGQWYAHPPAGETNAADIFQKAFAAYKDKEPKKIARWEDLPIVGMGEMPSHEKPLPKPMTERIAAYLEINREALQLLHQAASIPHCRYPIDLEQGLATKTPHLSDIRHGVRLLQLEAVLAAEKGQTEQAVQSVASIFGLARSLLKEPTLISQLVRAACQTVGVASLERVLPLLPSSKSHLQILDSALEDSEDVGSWVQAFTGERCMGNAVFSMSNSSVSSYFPLASQIGIEFRFGIAVYSFLGWLKMDHLYFLEKMEEQIRTVQLSYPNRIEKNKGLQVEIERNHETWKVKNIPIPFLRLGFYSSNRIFSWILLSHFGKAAVSEARIAALLHCSRMAVAVERYRISHKALPEKLDSLVPEFLGAIPADPFTGESLRYAKRSKGYVVYSVGEDKKDNDGVKKDSKGKPYTEGTDIPFAVER